MRFKKIFAMLLTGIMTVSMPGAVFAASTEEQIADVQAQKEAAQAELAQQQSDMASLESKKQEHSSRPYQQTWNGIRTGRAASMAA